MNIIKTISDYLPLINIGFYILICLPIVLGLFIGIFRGFKKSIYKFIIRIVLLLVFIFTLDLFANLLYTSKLFGLPALIEGAILKTSSTDTLSIKDLVHNIGEAYLSNINGMNFNLEYSIALLDGIAIFALKIVWAIIYFIIICTIIKIISNVIYKYGIQGKKEFRKLNNEPILGMFVGILNGVLGAFIFIVFFNGLMSLVSYSGDIKTVNNSSEISELSNNINTYEKDDILYLEDVNIPVNGNIIEVFSEGISLLKDVSNTWNDNFIVKVIDGVYIKDEDGIDEDGKIIYKESSSLDKIFDTLISFEYYVEGTSEAESITTKKEDLKLKINLLTEINKIYNSVMYLLDDDELISSNKVDFTKLDKDRVIEAFNYLENVDLLKIGTAIGVDYLLHNFNDKVPSSIDITDKSFQNELYNIDFTKDIGALGELIGSLVDLGVGKTLNKVLNKEKLDIYEILTDTLTPDKLSSESNEEYIIRKKNLRDNFKEKLANFEVIKKGSTIAIPIIINTALKDLIDKYELNDVDVNMIFGSDEISYVDKLIEEIDLNSDIKTIVELLFEAVDFNKEDNNLKFLMENYRKLNEAISERTDGFSMNDIEDFLDITLVKISKVSFIQSLFDIGVKVLSSTLTNSEKDNFTKYLTENNIFSSYISWESEIGDTPELGVRGVVRSILEADILSLVFDSSNIMNTLWAKESLEGYFSDTINSLFSLQVLENLSDTCLKDLLKDLLSKLSSNFEIKMSDELGDADHTYKNEILTLLRVLDDIIEGGKNNGAEKIDDIFNGNTTTMIKAISNVNAKEVESSAILAPTLVNFLVNFENDKIKIPYIYEDTSWKSVLYTTLDTIPEGFSVGDIKEEGELYRLINALKELASKDELLDLLNGSVSTDDILNTIKSLDKNDIDNLFKSVTIKATISSLINEMSGSGSSINVIIPSTSKENVLISNYREDEDVLISSTEYIEYIDSDNNTVRRYLAETKYLKGEELYKVIEALWQIDNLSSLTNNETMVSEIKKLNDNAVDNLGNETIYEEDNITHKTKIDVVFSSDILRLTISKFLTGDDFNQEYFIFPSTEIEAIDDFYYIKKDSILDLFESIFVVLEETNITDIKNISSDLINDIIYLHEEDLDKLLSSAILNATLSNIINKVDLINIPVISTDSINTYTKIGESLVDNETRYVIKTSELKLMMKDFKVIFPDGLDLNDSSAFEINKLVNNLLELGYLNNKGISSSINEFFSSKIILSTISKYVLDLTSSLVIPADAIISLSHIDYNDTTKEFSLVDLYCLTEIEAIALISSLDYVFPYKKGGLNEDLGSIDFESKIESIISLSNQELSNLFNSSILLGTISKSILDINNVVISVDEVTTSYTLKDNRTDLIDSLKYLLNKDDLIDFINSVSLLFPDGVDLNDINVDKISDVLALNNTDLNYLFDSTILRSTITKILLDTGSITMPKNVGATIVNEDINSVNNTLSFGSYIGTYRTTKEEFVNFINALKPLFGENIDLNNLNIDKFKSLSTMSNENLELLTNSYILNASISELLNNEGSETEIIIPLSSTIDYKKINNSLLEDVKMISKEEIKKLMKAMGYFDFETIGSANPINTVKLLNGESKEPSKKQIDIILESEILHSTLSNIILSMNSGSMDIVIPSEVVSAIDTIDNTSMTYTSLTSKNISIIEIKKLLNALNYIDIDGFSNGDSIFDVLTDLVGYVHLNTNTRKIDILLESDIITSTLSKYIYTLDVSEIDILIERNDSVLEINDPLAADPFIHTNESSKVGQDPNVYIINKEELKKFVVALSEFNLKELSNSINTMNILVEQSNYNPLKTKLETMLDSKILKLTFGSYIIDKKSELGFASLTIPTDPVYNTISSIEVVDYDNVNKTFNLSTCIDYIEGYNDSLENGKKYELERLVQGIKYLDLRNMSLDSLTELKDLLEVVDGKTRLEYINESYILRFTISKEIELNSKAGMIWRYVLPEEVYEYESGNRKVYTTFDGTTNLIKVEDIEDLIDSISMIDIRNTSSEDILSFSVDKISQLLNSKIIHATFSDKLKIALLDNANISSYYEEMDMERTDILDPSSYELKYMVTPDMVSPVYNHVIIKKEILNLFNSMSIMGSTNLNTIDVGMQTLQKLTDDNDNTNDDDETYDIHDNRAKFLRSIFFRKVLYDKWAYNFLADYHSVSGFTQKIDSLYTDLVDGSSNPRIYIDEAIHSIKWDNINPDEYELIINNMVISSSIIPNSLDPYTSYDYSAICSQPGIYYIKVIAKNYTVIYPPQVFKPYVYEEIAFVVTDTLGIVGETDEVFIVTNPTTDEESLEFKTVPNANVYTIKFYEKVTSNLVLTKQIIDNNPGTEELILSGILSPGEYSFTIEASNNTIEDENLKVYYQNSSCYNSLNESEAYRQYYKVMGPELNEPKYEIIDDYLYIVPDSRATSFDLTINGNPIALLEENKYEVGTDYFGYRIDLTTVVNSINNSVELTQNADNYISNDSSFEYYNLSMIDINSISLNLLTESISFDPVANADKYIVSIKRGEELILYKEILTSTLDISTLEKGYIYSIEIKAISTTNNYHSIQVVKDNIIVPKELKKPSYLNVNDELMLYFLKNAETTKYEINIYNDLIKTNPLELPIYSSIITDTEYSVETIDGNVYIKFDISDCYEYLVDGKYYVEVIAITETITRTNSSKSSLKEFSLTRIDRTYDLSISNEGILSFNDIEFSTGYKIIVTDLDQEVSNTYEINMSDPDMAIKEEGKVNVNINHEIFGEYTLGHKYRYNIITLTNLKGHTESVISVGVTEVK